MGPNQLNFVLVVNDNGELKTITREQLVDRMGDSVSLDYAINDVLDALAKKAKPNG